MVPTDFASFTKALYRTVETLQATLSRDGYDGYFEALTEFPLIAVIGALRRVEATWPAGKFFPRPADIRAIIAPPLSDADAAEHAWVRFRWALQHVTVYDSVDFGDAALHATILSLFGGWIQTAEIQSHRIAFVRVDFLKVYESNRRIGTLAPAKLPGLVELDATSTAHLLQAVPALTSSDAQLAVPLHGSS